MKYVMLCTLTALMLGACSTNPDGSINWADNPLNRAAGKIDDGLKSVNRTLTPKSERRAEALPDKNTRVGGAGGGRNGLAPGVHESGLSYKTMMEIGYIRHNPDYPKNSKQPYVFTSLNCSPGYGCHRPNNLVAPRP